MATCLSALVIKQLGLERFRLICHLLPIKQSPSGTDLNTPGHAEALNCLYTRYISVSCRGFKMLSHVRQAKAEKTQGPESLLSYVLLNLNALGAQGMATGNPELRALRPFMYSLSPTVVC